MEKFYIWGSIIISLALTVPPYALKQYGWDPLVEDCWYSNDDPKQRLAWQIGTQLFWSLLAVSGEIICTCIVVVYMIRHQLRKNRVLFAASSRTGTGSETRSHSGLVNNQATHANAYRGIILRIIVYPIASALFNLISVVCVIHATQNDGVHNWTGYRVLLLSDFVYGGRSILYALLAATDPALVRAMRTFIQHSRGISMSGAHSTLRGGTESKGNLAVHIELATVYQNDSGMATDNNGVPSKQSTSPLGALHGYTDHFNSMLKPLSDVEEEPLDAINLPGVQATPGDFSERSRIRVQDDRVRRQQEQFALSEARQEFSRQI